MCMKKIYLMVFVIVLIPVAVNFYLFARLGPMYADIESQDVAGNYRVFADRVEAGEVSNEQIVSRLRKMASGEDTFAKGLSIIRVSAYFWLISVFLIALLQAYLIAWLLKTHNKQLNIRL